MEINLVTEGFKFMVIGMTVVFSFLALMVFAISLQAKIVNRFFPDKPAAPKQADAAPRSDDASVIAAITGAIQSFRNKHN